MKLSRLIAATAFAFAASALATAGAAYADTPAAANANAASQSFTITASEGKFAPAAITVHVNQAATLRLTSGSGVHGIASSDLGIPQTMIMPGSTKTVTFTPTKTGTYTIHCTIICGTDHSQMTMVVKVVS